MTNAGKFISVVSPVYGCRSCLEELVDRISSSLSGHPGGFEVLLVDDFSPDGAWARIGELATTRPWLRGVRFARNFGQHYAISAGIERARGEVIVVMDCDLQDLPEEIPRLVESVEYPIEVAFAERATRMDGLLKRLGSWTFFRVLSWMTDVQQDHRTANFGAYSRRVIDTLNSMPERERCFPLMVKWTGLRSVSVPVRHARRPEGNSSYSFRKLRRLAIGIILSYSDKPLRIVVRLGLVFAALAFTLVGLSLFRYLSGDIQVAGFTSVVASIWLVGGVVISCIGIIGLYLGRLFVDAKARPYYIVSEELGTATPTPQQSPVEGLT